MPGTKRLLITGGGGMLATDLEKRALAQGMDVLAPPHADMDVTNPAQVQAAIGSFRPDVVVHAAAVGPDFCQLNPEDAYRIHTWGTACVARSAQRADATLVYISSCGLFGDEERYFSEYDPPELKTTYAQSKYQGEAEARELCERVYVVRPGWLFGGDPMHARNFVYQRLLEAQKKGALSSANDKFGSPTYTGDLVDKLFQLWDTQEYGLYHISNQGGCSRFDYVTEIIKAFELDVPVTGVDSSAFVRPAPVPNCELLSNFNLKFAGLGLLEPWENAVQRYVQELRSALNL